MQAGHALLNLNRPTESEVVCKESNLLFFSFRQQPINPQNLENNENPLQFIVRFLEVLQTFGVALGKSL